MIYPTQVNLTSLDFELSLGMFKYCSNVRASIALSATVASHSPSYYLI